MSANTSKAHPRISFFPLWFHFHITARLCSGFCGVSPSQKLQRDISRALALWPLPEFIFTLLVGCWVFWTPTCFSWCCKYFPAFIHHLSMFARSCSILVDELRAELSSASTYVLQVVWETAPNLFCLSWLFQQSLCRLFPEMHSIFHVPGRRNQNKAWLPALGTKMAFSHPLDITMTLVGCTPDCCMRSQQAGEAPLAAFTYTQKFPFSWWWAALSPVQQCPLQVLVLTLTLRVHPSQDFFIKQDKW